MTQIPEMVSVREAAKRGILPERAIRRLIAEKKIPVVRSGRTQYINYNGLVDMLNKGEGLIWQ